MLPPDPSSLPDEGKLSDLNKGKALNGNASAQDAYRLLESGLFNMADRISSATDPNQRELAVEDAPELVNSLRNRFFTHMDRHPGLNWTDYFARLKARPEMLARLSMLEEEGGEPDVVGFNKETGQFQIFECSVESPRVNIVYDQAGEAELLKHHPDEIFNGNAQQLAAETGARLFTVEDIKKLFSLGQFNKHTWCWLETPPELRAKGLALFAYCDGEGCYILETQAHSLYSARGARFKLEI
jgi:hypothetical protein